MKYPARFRPKSKHDMHGPKIPSFDDVGVLESSSQLLEVMERLLIRIDYPPNSNHISTIYTYEEDAPIPQIANKVIVLAYCDCNRIGMLRRLKDSLDDVDDDGGSGMWNKCTWGVKRGDGDYYHKLDSRNKKNSSSFATIMKDLTNRHLTALVAVGGMKGRIGFLFPITDELNPHPANDYAACCLVGDTQQAIDQYLSSSHTTTTLSTIEQQQQQQQQEEVSGMHTPPGTPPTKPPPPQEEDEEEQLWQPDDDNDNNNNDKAFSSFENLTTNADDELWQPDTDRNEMSWDTSATDAWNSNPTHTNIMQSDTDNGMKRKRDDNNDDDYNDNDFKQDQKESEFHTNSGAAAADTFYSNLTRSLASRADSRLFHMRNFNGWIKATQIAELNPRSTTMPRNNPLRVLDMACGKGGDLGKWVLHNRGIGNYVGVDVARGSLKDAAIRARKMREKLKNKCVFMCADLGHDVPGRLRSKNHKQMQKLLSWNLASESHYEFNDPKFEYIPGGGILPTDNFDVVSIQFAIHYMMQTVQRARRFFHTVNRLLDVGGIICATTIDSRVVMEKMMGMGYDFLSLNTTDNNSQSSLPVPSKPIPDVIVVKVGEGACQLKFERSVVKRLFDVSKKSSDFLHPDNFGLEYTFTLVEGDDHSAGVGEAVDLPEWLIPLPVLTSLAEEAGMKLEYANNFHEYYANRKDPVSFPIAHNALYTMKVLDRTGSISQQEWDISRMYMAVQYRKVRECDPNIILEDDDDEDMKDEPTVDIANTETSSNNEANNKSEKEIDSPAKLTVIDMSNPKAKKMFSMAMVKAKTKVGNDVWNSLASDEKTEYTNRELIKML